MPDAVHPMLDVLTAAGRRAPRMLHVRTLPARSARFAEWPSWADPDLVAGYRALGVEQPWSHQVVAADAAWNGRHVALATPTGSGKSLGYWLPSLTAVRRDAASRLLDPGRIETARSRGTVLYLCPTKSLAADQLRSVHDLLAASSSMNVRVATCDGDTAPDERRWVREYADVVLTNPDFLHFSLLPGHRYWSRMLRDLRFIVVDEGHAYRGVFGAHVALVLRRLQRLANHYRAGTYHRSVSSSPPTCVVASATSADPARSAARLIGVAEEEVLAVTDSGSPSGQRTFALWEPPVLPGASSTGNDDSGSRVYDGEFVRLSAAERRSDPAGSSDMEWQSALGDATAVLLDPTSPPPSPQDLAADHDESSEPVSREQGPGGQEAGEQGPGEKHRGPVETSLPGEHHLPDTIATPGPRPEHPRRTATAEAGDLLADLVLAGAQTLVFTRSRRGAEAVAAQARDHVRPLSPALADDVAAYRGGYLPEERRLLEESLRDGRMRGLATTNALELGVDVSGLDAVLIAGWPGTRMSVWQQAGRAGRAGSDGLVVFIAREDPLDTFLVHNPEAFFDTPLEATAFDPTNPYVLAPHLCAAAAEVPLRATDLGLFGRPEDVRSLLDFLVERGALRRRPSGWYWTHARPASAMTDLRGSGGSPVQVVEAETGRLLGTVDAASADASVHDGAVYVHQGATYVVDRFDPHDGVALVHRGTVDYGTWSRTSTELSIVDERTDGPVTPQRSVTWGYGMVEVHSQVTGFQRRSLPDMRILGSEPLDLPERTLATAAVWWTVSEELLEQAGIDHDTAPGALHAAEHASIGLLPLLATCDRWDLGGVSTALHPDTGAATVFVYDAYPGGAGFAERGYELGETWLAATRDAIARCPCASGCPACVQSPKCGNYNSPLDKDAAVRLLDAVLHSSPGKP